MTDSNHIFSGFLRCTKICINNVSLPVQPSVSPSLYPFFSQTCLHIIGNVFRSTAKQPTQNVDPQEFKGAIRTSYTNLRISTILQTTTPHEKPTSIIVLRNSFIFKNVNHRYKHLVLDNALIYFVSEICCLTSHATIFLSYISDGT